MTAASQREPSAMTPARWDWTHCRFAVDTKCHRVRGIDASDEIAAFASAGERDYDRDAGPTAESLLTAPTGTVIDSVGNLYLADPGRITRRESWVTNCSRRSFWCADVPSRQSLAASFSAPPYQPISALLVELHAATWLRPLSDWAWTSRKRWVAAKRSQRRSSWARVAADGGPQPRGTPPVTAGRAALPMPWPRRWPVWPHASIRWASPRAPPPRGPGLSLADPSLGNR